MTDSGQTELGRVGIWTFAYEGQPAGRVRESAAEIEELGYGAIWYGEAFGRDTVGQAWLLLSATQRIVVASGIANIAFRDPIATATATRALGEAFPGRYVLGLGGHRVDDTVHELDGYPVPARGRAVTTMRAYLEAMDAVPAHGPMADPAPRRVLAALGPKMLQLAAEHTWGAHPYFVSTEHTAQARQIMGPKAFLAVEQAVVLDTDLSRARQVATEHVAELPLGTASGGERPTTRLRRRGHRRRTEPSNGGRARRPRGSRSNPPARSGAPRRRSRPRLPASTHRRRHLTARARVARTCRCSPAPPRGMSDAPPLP